MNFEKPQVAVDVEDKAEKTPDKKILTVLALSTALNAIAPNADAETATFDTVSDSKSIELTEEGIEVGGFLEVSDIREVFTGNAAFFETLNKSIVMHDQLARLAENAVDRLPETMTAVEHAEFQTDVIGELQTQLASAKAEVDAAKAVNVRLSEVVTARAEATPDQGMKETALNLLEITTSFNQSNIDRVEVSIENLEAAVLDLTSAFASVQVASEEI